MPRWCVHTSGQTGQGGPDLSPLTGVRPLTANQLLLASERCRESSRHEHRFVGVLLLKMPSALGCQYPAGQAPPPGLGSACVQLAVCVCTAAAQRCQMLHRS